MFTRENASVRFLQRGAARPKAAEKNKQREEAERWRVRPARPPFFPSVCSAPVARPRQGGSRFRCPAWCGASGGAWRCTGSCCPCGTCGLCCVVVFAFGGETCERKRAPSAAAAAKRSSASAEKKAAAAVATSRRSLSARAEGPGWACRSSTMVGRRTDQRRVGRAGVRAARAACAKRERGELQLSEGERSGPLSSLSLSLATRARLSLNKASLVAGASKRRRRVS